MTQSRFHSFLEACGNTATGFLIAIVVQQGINIYFGLPLSWGDNVAITTVFTVVSVVRSYLWRRFMEGHRCSAQ